MAKELKTFAELDILLHERVERSPVGRVPNPQWIKIIAADPEKEGANWRVAHSGAPGDFADAIEREMRQLQKLYDLSS
ncbi:MAG: hypothetical protein MN733_42105 [Nitrososphaera sp.]|nr:hypothetical protein [Nitrososphaera sp.]